MVWWVNLVITNVDFVVSNPAECMLVLVGNTDSRKARERKLAKIDEYRRALGTLKSLRDKNEVTYGGGGGTTPVTTACPEAGE